MSSSQADLPLHHHPSHQQLNPTPPDVLPDHSVPLTTPPPSPPPNPVPVPPTLPELSAADLSASDFSLSLESIFGLPQSSQPPSRPEGSTRSSQDGRHLAKVQKRASLVQRRQSNVMKLAEEHDKLKEELRAMTERLEAAERRRQELERSREKYRC